MPPIRTILLFLGLIFAAANAGAKTWLVAQHGKRGVASINDIDFHRLKPGDIVIVRDGRYEESLQAVQGVHYKAIGNVSFRDIRIENVSSVSLEGFRLNGNLQGIAVSIVDSRNIRVENCRVRNFEAAISVSRSQDVVLKDLILEDNERGVYLFRSHRVAIERSLIGRRPRPPEEDSVNGVGVEIYAGGRITLDHNTIVRNPDNAVTAGSTDGLVITNNIIAFNGWGLNIQSDGRRTVDFNAFHGNANGDARPPEMPQFPPAISGKRNYPFEPGFVNADKGDWRLRKTGRAAAADSKGSYLGAFAPIDADRDSTEGG